jgi:Spy/CpxP family protein refolding chaperone
MIRASLFIGLLLIATLACAQRQAPPPGNASPMPPFMGAPDFGRMAPLGAGFGRWWTNPGIAGQVQLSDAQIQQLERVTTRQRLALIDAMANGMKAFVLLQPLLDASQFDEAAANQQLDALAATASRLVKEMGGGVLQTRKILTAEQWKKVQSLQQQLVTSRPAMGAPLPPRQP